MNEVWNEVVRLREEEGQFTVINFDQTYSQCFWPRK